MSGSHGSRRCEPKLCWCGPRPTSRPGPSQGASGGWWCRWAKDRDECGAQDGVDLGEQRGDVGIEAPHVVPGAIEGPITHRRGHDLQTCHRNYSLASL